MQKFRPWQQQKIINVFLVEKDLYDILHNGSDINGSTSLNFNSHCDRYYLVRALKYDYRNKLLIIMKY